MSEATTMKWTKTDKWRMATYETPTYSTDAGFTIIGSWTTEGDNQRGWRKVRIYELYVRGFFRDGGSLKRMKALAEKIAKAEGGAT